MRSTASDGLRLRCCSRPHHSILHSCDLQLGAAALWCNRIPVASAEVAFPQLDLVCAQPWEDKNVSISSGCCASSMRHAFWLGPQLAADGPRSADRRADGPRSAERRADGRADVRTDAKTSGRTGVRTGSSGGSSQLEGPECARGSCPFPLPDSARCMEKRSFPYSFQRRTT